MRGVAQKPRIVKAGSWSELPDVLEPGVYIINGARIVVKERVSRDSLKRTFAIMRRRGGVYV